MDGSSLDIIPEQISQLKQIFPEVFTENQIDFTKLQEILNKNITQKNEYYQLSWAGKSEARANIYKTTTQTLKPCSPLNPLDNPHTNTLIKGENLEVLRILQKSYFNKVKMIYIDPPYNTGNDYFTYPDDFKEDKKEYLERTELDNKTNIWKKNTRENGHFHSNWLSMMLPRLSIARQLLRDDGVIFISIDDNEASNLKLLCDEVFGEENFVADIIWNSTKSVTNTAIISESHNYNLVYFKNKQHFIKNRHKFRLPEDGEGFANPDNDKRGYWKADPFQVGGWRPNQQYEIVNPNTGEIYLPNEGCSWKNDFNKFQELLKDNRIVFGVQGDASPQRKRFLTEALERGKVSKTLWNDVGTTTNGTQTLKKIFDGKIYFTNPKPVDLIKKMLQLATQSTENHIILDFFAGSGTTAQAVIELNEEDGGNRKVICVQLEESLETTSEGYKAGYRDISEITETRINKVIEKIKKQREGKIEFSDKPLPKCQAYKLDKSNFKSWRNDVADVKAFQQQLFDFQDSQLSPAEGNEDSMFIELCLKRGLGLNIRYTKDDDFYKVPTSEGELWFCFTQYKPEYEAMILAKSPKEVYMLDSNFKNNVMFTSLKLRLKNQDITLILI